jgi:hypothetical protein
LRPFPDTSLGTLNQKMTFNDVNSESIRQQLISQYKIMGSGEGFNNYGAGTYNQYMPTENMFTTSRDEDKKFFEAFPEGNMIREPIYKTAEIFDSPQYRFFPKTGQIVQQTLQNCIDIVNSETIGLQPYQGQIYADYANSQCPDNPGKVLTDCGDNVPCVYDYTLLNAEILANEAKSAWSSFVDDRYSAIRQYNSCGPINIEYPEFLIKTPALSSSYLQGDTARFECFQTHWIKGDYEYKCGIVVDYNHPNNYRFEWNKGWQPWCRTREMDNFLKWLTDILVTLAVIVVFILIFLCCWCTKVRRRQEREANRSNDDTYDERPRFPRSYDIDSMPRKSNSLSSINNAQELRPKEPLGGQNGTTTKPPLIRPAAANGSVFTTPSRTPDTPELRARHNAPREETKSLLGLNTSV